MVLCLMDTQPHDMNTALVLKVEQCRRLARQVSDPTVSRRLFDLADEYVQHIKINSAK